MTAPAAPGPRLAPLGDLLRKSHLPALDGLRAIAVGVVIIYHSGALPVPGDIGVAAFFVLSGFLITWLLIKEHDATGRVSLRNFYVRRVLRIFPAYYVFMAGSLILDYILQDPWSPGLIASGFLYVVNYYNAVLGHPTTSVAHAWSLAIEEQFYLLWPALFLVLSRRGAAFTGRALIAIILAVAGWRSFLYIGMDVGTAWPYNAFDCRFDNLAVGCLLAVACQNPRFLDATRASARSPWLPLLTAAAVVWSRAGISESWHYGPGLTIEALLLALFIVQILWLHPTWQWRWLENPVVSYLGRISYPLYLYHIWALGVAHKIGVLSPIGVLVIGSLVAIVVASGSYYIVEKPFLRLKRRFEVR